MYTHVIIYVHIDFLPINQFSRESCFRLATSVKQSHIEVVLKVRSFSLIPTRLSRKRTRRKIDSKTYIYIYTPRTRVEKLLPSRKIVQHEEPVLESAPEPRDIQRGPSDTKITY